MLQVIHNSGWVHRDISVSNIYLLDDHGLLGDLEYAKSVDVDEDPLDLKKGISRTVRLLLSRSFYN